MEHEKRGQNFAPVLYKLNLDSNHKWCIIQIIKTFFYTLEL